MKKLIIGFVASTLLLTACGGGGGKSNDTPPNNSSIATNISSASASSIGVSSTSSSSVAPSSSSSSPLASSSSSFSSSSLSSRSSSVASVPFTLTSTSFVDGSTIPNKYSSCPTLPNISPELKWEITSDDVKSFVLIMEDSDAIPIAGHPYVHWDVYNIPGSTREITEGATRVAMPIGSAEGANDDGDHRYTGPCPPSGTHHYHFTLYAINKSTLVIDTALAIQRSQFENAHAADIIQKVDIVGLFSH